MENQIFIKPREFPIIICKQCKIGVRPSEVSRHIQGAQHRLGLPTGRQLQHAIQQWNRVQECERWEVPTAVHNPIPGLPVHQDGLLCTRTSECGYVVRSVDVIKRHWREKHGWKPSSSKGRPRAIARDNTQQQIQQFSRTVTYQQAFDHSTGRHYIHVQGHSSDQNPPVEPPVQQASQIHAELDKMEELYQKHIHQPIQIEAGQRDEANPWLRRTQWAVYLAGLNPDDLVQCVQQPDPEDQSEEALTTAAIWDSMAAVARISQKVSARVGHTIQIEAVRVERDKTPSKPLQAYMVEEAIVKHSIPWQQVLMFFARTQIPHEWNSPKYSFTRRQQRAWEKLWDEAQAVAQSSRSSSPVRNSPDPKSANSSRGASPVPSQANEDEFFQFGNADRDTPDNRAQFELSATDTACLDFCMELLNQRTRVEDYECALICALAVQGRGEAGWRDADSYPPILSRIIKVARFMMVHKAMRLDPQAGEMMKILREHRMAGTWEGESAIDEPGYISAGYSSPPPSSQTTLIHFSQNGQARSFRDWVVLMVDKFMVRGTDSPMQWILDLRTYGLKIHYNSTTPGHVGWMSQDRLCYKELTFTMGQFKGFIHQLVSDTRQLLLDELMFTDTTDVPKIPWKTLYDDPTQSGHGWSFLQDTRTPWPVDGAKWIQQRLRREPQLAKQFFEHGVPRMAKIDSFMRRVVAFRRKLSIAIHICGGQPARAPELLSIRHKNTDSGGHRNVFIEDGMVTMVTSYHKGFYASNDVKIIHRYLPRDIGELVVWYLWLVLPFVERMELYQDHRRDKERSDQHQRAAYMWPPDPDTQRVWSSERLRDDLKSETSRGLDGAINLTAYRDIAIGISRRYMRHSNQFPNNVHTDDRTPEDQDDADDEGGMGAEEWTGHVADLQAAHSSHVAGMVYGREITEQPGTTAHRRQLFRLSSTDWHRFLGFVCGDSECVDPRGASQPSPWEMEAERSRQDRRWKLQETPMQPELQKMMGDELVRFRGVQGPAIEAIQQGQSPIITVMPTGGGKSVLFMLPAWVAGGTTVVVVPLIALRSDMQRRCQRLNIRCIEWESRQPADDANIVLVTPESALGPDFMGFLNRQRMQHRLDRIVIDECHVMLNDQKDFRPVMARLGRLSGFGVQMVYITATLPPREESKMFIRIETTREKVQLFRARTSRSNVAYRVVRPMVDRQYMFGDRWIEAPQVLSMIRDRIRRSRPGKVIIYTSVVRTGQTLASELGCGIYHSRQLDKARVLGEFQSGQSPVIVATSALGMGVDIPDIRCIIHIGQPRTLMDYAQESGRTGRDGQRSEAMIIQPAETQVPEYMIQDTPEDEVRRIQQYMEAEHPSCRRYILDGYLDGTVDGYRRSHCGDHGQVEQMCDGCDPDWLAHEEEIDGTASPPRVDVVVDMDTDMDNRVEDSESHIEDSRDGMARPPRVDVVVDMDTDMDSRVEDSESHTEDSSDEPMHDRGVTPYEVNADPSEIWQVDVRRWVTRDTIRAAQFGSRVAQARLRKAARYRVRQAVSGIREENFEEHANMFSDEEECDRAVDGPRQESSADAVYSESDKGSEIFQSQAGSPGQSIRRRIVSEPDDKLEGFQSQGSRQRGQISPQFQRDPSTTTSAVQIRKRAAVEQAEERSPQRARNRQAANQEFQRQDQERQMARVSFQQEQELIGPQEGFLEQQVAQWVQRCLLCEQQGRAYDHELFQCYDARHHEARQWMIEVRKEIRGHWAKFCGCYQCGLPQTICKSFQSHGPCLYRNVMISAIAMMVFGPQGGNSAGQEVRKGWARRLDEHGVAIEDQDGLVRYLGSRHGNEEVFKLAVEFVWLRRAWIEVSGV